MTEVSTPLLPPPPPLPSPHAAPTPPSYTKPCAHSHCPFSRIVYLGLLRWAARVEEGREEGGDGEHGPGEPKPFAADRHRALFALLLLFLLGEQQRRERRGAARRRGPNGHSEGLAGAQQGRGASRGPHQEAGDADRGVEGRAGGGPHRALLHDSLPRRATPSRR